LGRDASHKPEGTPRKERTAMNSEAAGHRNPWSLVRKAVKFDCPYFSARDDLVAFDGSPPFSYSSIRVKKHGVCVAPIDPQGCVTIVGQRIINRVYVRISQQFVIRSVGTLDTKFIRIFPRPLLVAAANC